MDRIQPPPNYYGAPYPNQMDMNRTYQNLGPTPPYPSNDQTRGDTDNSTNDNTSNIKEYYTQYIEGNLGKNIAVYCSFTDATEWHDKVFKGKLFTAGDDYVIVEDTTSGKKTLIFSVYIHFIEFTD